MRVRYIRLPEQLVADGIIERRSAIAMALNRCLEVSRCEAAMQVLLSIPEEDYAALKERQAWLVVPPLGANGFAGSIPEHKKEIIYLSPFLERFCSHDGCRFNGDTQECALSVAHEIAHSILGHGSIVPGDGEAVKRCENEAWAKVEEWGVGTAEEIGKLRQRIGW